MNLDNWLPPMPCKGCGKAGQFDHVRNFCNTCYENQRVKLLETKCNNCHQVKATNQDFICKACFDGGYYARTKTHRRKFNICH